MLTRILSLGLPIALLVATVPAGPAAANAQKGWFEKAVKKVGVKVEPAAAKPGQVVTFKITIDLQDGYHTYPTTQPDKAAAGYVNLIKFPAQDAMIFVGRVDDPKGFDAIADAEQGIKELRKYSGTVTFARKAVVSPKAAPGTATAKATLKLMVCDKDRCFAPKDVPVEAALKVLDGPPVPVPQEFAAEVTKALAGK